MPTLTYISRSRLDADLIMLGLASHEPHFCILREKVLVRRRRQALGAMSDKTQFQQTHDMQLLHVGVLREYVFEEMVLRELLEAREGDGLAHDQAGEQEGTKVLPRNVTKERMIDDFIFMTYNEFLSQFSFASCLYIHILIFVLFQKFIFFQLLVFFWEMTSSRILHQLT